MLYETCYERNRRGQAGMVERAWVKAKATTPVITSAVDSPADRAWPKGAAAISESAIAAAIEDAKAADGLTVLCETRIPHLINFIDFASWHTACVDQDVRENRTA